MKVYLVPHKPLCDLSSDEIHSLNQQDLEERKYVKKLTKIQLREYRKRYDAVMKIDKILKPITEENADAIFRALIDYIDVYIKIRTDTKDEVNLVAFMKDSDNYIILSKDEFQLIISHRLKLLKINNK